MSNDGKHHTFTVNLETISFRNYSAGCCHPHLPLRTLALAEEAVSARVPNWSGNSKLPLQIAAYYQPRESFVNIQDVAGGGNAR